MNQLKKYTCLTYSDISFLISNDDIFTATCCSDESFLKDEKGLCSKIQFSQDQLDYIDFDDCVRLFGVSIKSTEIKTSVILRNRELYEDKEYFALLTSADCHVISVPEEKFRQPCAPCSIIFSKIGLKSLYYEVEQDEYMFDRVSVCYELDINKFLGKIYEKNSGC